MRKIIPVVVAGATVLAVAGGTFGYTTLNKAVTLSVDGQARSLSTLSGTVGDVLAAQHISVGPHDVVAPSPQTRLTDGTLIAVRFGREVSFKVDGKPQTVWTTATSVDQAVAALGIDTAGAALSTSRSAPIGRQGLSVDIATRKTVTVLAAGHRRTFATTATTVGQALAQAKITVDGNDQLSAAPSTRLVDGSRFRYTKVDVRTVQDEKRVGFRTVRKDSAKLTRGVTKVETAGAAGRKTITYRETRHDGKLVSRRQTASHVTREPVTAVILVGTKKPAPTGGSGGGGSASGGVWDKIAACESGGNWSINTGNGFYGGLQFTLGTWRANGGSGMPNHASKGAQIAVAKRVQQAQGWGAWPACTAKLGLR